MALRCGRCAARRGRSRSSSGHEEPCRRGALPSAPNREAGSCWSLSRSRLGLCPGLVDEDQAPRIDEALIVSPSFAVATDVRAILLARDEGLFLNVTPILRKKRLIIEVSDLTPRSAERRSQR